MNVNTNQLMTIKKITIGLWVMTAIFVVIGLLVVQEAISALTWQQTTATIIDSKVMRQSHINTINNHIHTGYTRYDYIVTAKYQYTFNNKQYTSSRYAIGTGDTISGPYNEKSEAREWLKNSKYKIGNKINIYLNPNNPSESVISHKLHWSMFVPFFIAILFMILALILRICHSKIAEQNSRK